MSATQPIRRVLALLTALFLLSALALPAMAGEDEPDDDVSTERVEAELSPALADVGEEVELEIELDDDFDADESEDDAEDGAADEAADPDATDEPADEAADPDATDEPADETADPDATDEPADETADPDATDEPADEAADPDATDEPADEAADPDATEEDAVELGLVSVEADWGDGTVEPLVIDGDEVEGSHVYVAEGEYVVTATLVFDDGTSEVIELLAQVGGGTARLDGSDRFETAIEISEETYGDDEAGAVLLARADAFADALAAAPLALGEDAPILLTATAEVPASVLAEIDRVLVEGGTVYLLGGTAAIDPSVEEALSLLGYEVIRIAGDDRIETALQIAQFLLDAGVDVDEVILAAAGTFPDALAVSGYAAAAEAPVLLTDGQTLDPRVADLLGQLGDVEVIIPGGPAVISDAVVAEVQALGLEVERIAGDDRFSTSAALAEALYGEIETVIVATGVDFPDALAAGVQAGLELAPILLVGDELNDEVAAFIEAHAETIDDVYILGGPGAVPQAVVDAIQQLLEG